MTNVSQYGNNMSALSTPDRLQNMSTQNGIFKNKRPIGLIAPSFIISFLATNIDQQLGQIAARSSIAQNHSSDL